MATEPEEPWVSDDDIENLASMEKTVHADESPEQTARRLLRENTPTAILKIIQLSKHGDTNRMQFEASKYIVDRVLGTAGSDAWEGEKNPVQAFVDDVVEYTHATDNTN